MTDFLVRQIARQPRHLAARVALGLVMAALGLGLRMALAPWMGNTTPFATFVLAVLVAVVFGGAAAGAACMAAVTAFALFVLQPPVAGPMGVRRLYAGLVFFLASGSFVIWIVSLLRAALAREVAAREAERLLKLELHHRVKNTLAVVQSLADQTFRNARDPQAARADFGARLTALADAHDVLVDAGWGPVTLETLAERTLAPFRPAPDRLALAGPPVTVAPEAAVALTLCLHELATNATKHGALSAKTGQVNLSWRTDEIGGRRRLSLEWTETGGPAPSPPDGRAGFGSRLLTRALAAQPNAETQLSFPAQGVCWRATFDL